MTKKEIKAAILLRTRIGEKKESIYESLKGSYLSEAELADMIQEVPSLERRKRFAVWRTILIVLLCIEIVTKMINGLLLVIDKPPVFWLVLLILPVFQFLLLYAVIRYIPGFGTAVGVIVLTGMFWFMKTAVDNYSLPTLLTLLTGFVMIGIGLYLEKQLFLKVSIIKEKITDYTGQEQERNRYLFVE